MRNAAFDQVINKSVLLVAAMLLFAGLIACKGSGEESDPVAWENVSENGITGLGKAFYANGFLYYTDDNYIYEYDLQSGESIALNRDQSLSAVNLYASTDGVYYNTGVGGAKISKIPFDTQSVEEAYQVETATNQFAYVFHEDEIAYGLSMQMGDLVQYQKESGASEVLDTEVLMFAKEGQDLYYIKYYKEEERTELILRKDGVTEKQVVDVDISPIQLSIEGDHLILSEMGSWQLHDYNLTSGELTKLDGASSVTYQLRGDSLYYVSRDSGHEFVKIRVRSLSTGEEKVACANVRQEFCTMAEDVLICWDYFYQPLLVEVGEEESEMTELPVLAD